MLLNAIIPQYLQRAVDLAKADDDRQQLSKAHFTLASFADEQYQVLCNIFKERLGKPWSLFGVHFSSRFEGDGGEYGIFGMGAVSEDT